jgi:hypothetical protein
MCVDKLPKNLEGKKRFKNDIERQIHIGKALIIYIQTDH